ncbi:hypothetical protein [Rhabdaerophilum sp. SD176]|uniref:hypothetical protein n=1 Tax=Rhabdaerophilum sp. SD176 TaxID=2983548 RepID=UPI0024E0176F|nr:hypothetical protein [Rhabdaerophilum sp. SD176]
MRIVTGLASVVLIMGLGQGAAMAQQANAPAAAPAAPRTAQRAVPKNAAEIILTNARSGAVVTGLSVTSAAGKSVATLKKPLEPGKKITIRLPKNSGCTFAVNASFSDDAEFDQTDVNLCMDKTVRFTD